MGHVFWQFASDAGINVGYCSNNLHICHVTEKCPLLIWQAFIWASWCRWRSWTLLMGSAPVAWHIFSPCSKGWLGPEAFCFLFWGICWIPKHTEWDSSMNNLCPKNSVNGAPLLVWSKNPYNLCTPPTFTVSKAHNTDDLDTLLS